MYDDQPCENTDRELWRERNGDYYADSIHVTAQEAIGINCGGMVYVKPVRDWHALAARLAEAEQKLAHCKEQAIEGLEVEHDCPAMYACASIYAELATDADRAACRASTGESESHV